jgi:hypothetical protein
MVNDLDGVRVPVSPDKAKAPLFADANAVLAFTIACNASRRFPGGAAKLRNSVALANCRSFLRATSSMARKRRLDCRWCSRSVSAQRND